MNARDYDAIKILVKLLSNHNKYDLVNYYTTTVVVDPIKLNGDPFLGREPGVENNRFRRTSIFGMRQNKHLVIF